MNKKKQYQMLFNYVVANNYCWERFYYTSLSNYVYPSSRTCMDVNSHYTNFFSSCNCSTCLNEDKTYDYWGYAPKLILAPPDDLYYE